jgi:hypothetical protein
MEVQEYNINMNLSEIIHYSKYAKYLEESKRRETFRETSIRNKEMHIKKFPFLKTELDNIYEKFVLEKKLLPSMRSMQFAGEPLLKNNVRMFNCAYLPIDSILAFSEIMFLLLSGAGVGFSVQKEHIEVLPTIKQNKEVFNYSIEDSIEGWANSIKILMDSYFNDKPKPVFDYSKIRDKGEKLITSGGKAPGHEPLKNCHNLIVSFLDELLKDVNEVKLRSIHIHKIVCLLADSVLAGGIRRSATISLFSFNDTEMLKAKSGEWWVKNPEFARANNSAVAPYDEITEEQFYDFWQYVVNSKSGEPGIIWVKNKNMGFNPCFTGDTQILSKNGYKKMEEIIGKQILINKNGEEVEGEIWISGVKKVIELKLSNNKKIKCTDNHIFLTNNNQEIEAKNLLGKRLKTVITLNKKNDKFVKLGFMQGDGNLTRLNSKEHKGLEINIGKKDNDILNLFNLEKTNLNQRSFYVTEFNELLKELGFSFKKLYQRSLPLTIEEWDKNNIASFLKGLYSANGSVIKGHRIALKSTCLNLILQTQKLLNKFNIDTYYTVNKEKINCFNNGIYLCKESYDLNISKFESILNFAKYINFVHIYKQASLIELINQKSPKVINIKILDKKELVYDFSLKDNTHWGVIEGVIAHNCGEASLEPYSFCNLVELNAEKVNNQEDFNNLCYVGAFLNTIQASYTNFSYLRPIWQNQTEKDSLIGTSLTGIASGKLDNIDLSEGALIVKLINKQTAKKININKASRTTLVKPSGTASLVLGTSSGIHDYYSEYYIRRVRLNKNESLYKYIKKQYPDLVEDIKNDTNGAVISFPQKAPTGSSLVENNTALSMIDRCLKYNLEWIRTGHRVGDNYHNVSATIYVKENEWQEVGKKIWDNRYSYHGLSFFPVDDNTYEQAPYEKINKKQYDRLNNVIKDFNLSKLIENEDETHFLGEIACSGNVCEVI